jgi:hypothetical protein
MTQIVISLPLECHRFSFVFFLPEKEILKEATAQHDPVKFRQDASITRASGGIAAAVQTCV